MRAMGSNWMWLVPLVAAVGHALRWIAPDASLRQVKIPAAFVVLYALYAVVLARAGAAGMLVALIIVEIALRLFRRSRPQPPPGRRGGGIERLRR